MKKIYKLVSLFLLSLVLYSCGDISQSSEQYLVQFDIFGDLNIIEEQKINAGDLISKPKIPDFFGYQFSHFEYENLNRPWRFETDVVINDMVLTAVYDRVELESTFKYNNTYKIVDGSIFLGFNLLFDGELVNLENNVEKVTILDGDLEIVHEYEGKDSIYHNLLGNEIYVYKIDTLDELTYFAYMHIDSHYNKAIINRTNDEAYNIDDIYYEEYEVMFNNETVSLLNEDNNDIFISNREDSYSFTNFNNIFNSKYFINDINNEDENYKLFIVNNDNEITLVDFDYKQNDYYRVTYQDNIHLNINETNKVLKDTNIEVSIDVPANKIIKSFKINGIN